MNLRNSLPEFKNPPAPPMRKLNDAELEMIEKMGGTGFSPEQIAEVLEVNAAQFMLIFADKSSNVYKVYRKGFLESEMKLRIRIMRDAANGSSPAQTLAKKIMDECAFKNNLNEG